MTIQRIHYKYYDCSMKQTLLVQYPYAIQNYSNKYTLLLAYLQFQNFKCQTLLPVIKDGSNDSLTSTNNCAQLRNWSSKRMQIFIEKRIYFRKETISNNLIAKLMGSHFICIYCRSFTTDEYKIKQNL